MRNKIYIVCGCNPHFFSRYSIVDNSGGRRNTPEKNPWRNPGENPRGKLHRLFCETEGREEHHIRAKFDEAKTDEATGRRGLRFRSYDYIHHLVNVVRRQSLGLEYGLWLRLG